MNNTSWRSLSATRPQSIHSPRDSTAWLFFKLSNFIAISYKCLIGHVLTHTINPKHPRTPNTTRLLTIYGVTALQHFLLCSGSAAAQPERHHPPGLSPERGVIVLSQASTLPCAAKKSAAHTTTPLQSCSMLNPIYALLTHKKCFLNKICS